MTYHPGDLVVRRFLHPDRRLAAVQAARVVSDDDRGLLLFVDIGAESMRRTDLTGAPTRHLPVADELAMPTMLAPVRRETFRSLLLLPPGAPHSVSWSWLADGTFTGWYANLETPARRWPGGVDSHDQTLDVLVTADRSWFFKDEEDLGALEPAEAAAVRAEGERLGKLAETATFPFDGTWLDFTPPPEWTPATLPPWWDAATS
ncbi:DUF402 domain-containing protein [Actinoplanes auranticolor]|uniref:DUF402 domain-containing protein n=1 Tax=Actinoplanes auranticolor TaxID=47988 RepID=A0A919SW90_9ACTN|nr:DUF402 domain-containing protein [Actinoplanes auranticolor]GIM79154.1 hypothetical protein Aau02nite_84350 [Actinoplanes auranticolor]